MLNAFRRRGDRDVNRAVESLWVGDVLNAFRRRGDRDLCHTNSLPSRTQCSTPFGDEAIGTIFWCLFGKVGSRVLNAFRRRGDRDPTPIDLADTDAIECSTPFGDEAIGTNTLSAAHGESAVCSTPFGDEAIGTSHRPGRRLLRDVLNAFRRRGDRDSHPDYKPEDITKCSTPFGDEAIGTGAHLP